MYLYREYFKAKVYTIWVHGPLRLYTMTLFVVFSRVAFLPRVVGGGPTGVEASLCCAGM